MDLAKKIGILANAAKYDVSCATSGSKRKNSSGGLGNALSAGICHSFADDGRFAFGTWKIEVLGGYTNAILLIGVAGFMLFHSAERLIAPMPIHYDQAIAIDPNYGQALGVPTEFGGDRWQLDRRTDAQQQEIQKGPMMAGYDVTRVAQDFQDKALEVLRAR